MSFPRALVMAFLLALGAMLLLGAGQAAAKRTVFCEVNEALCKGADVMGDEFTAEAKAALHFSKGGTVECASSISQGEMGRITALSFGECSEGCTVKANGLPYVASYSSLSGGNAVLTIFGDVTLRVTLAVKCKTAECVYASSPFPTEFEGGEPGNVYVSQSLVEKEESFFCPESVTWEGAYTLTSPASALYVANRLLEGPVFCAANLEPCPQESIATGISSQLTETGMVVGTLGGGGTISCAGGFFLFQNEEREAEGPWRYKSGSFWECTSPTYTACDVHFAGIPYKALLFPEGEGNGQLQIVEGLGEVEPTLEIGCTYLETPYECVYSTPEFALGVNGGEPALLEESGTFLLVEGAKAFCTPEVTLAAEYEASGPVGEGVFLAEAES